MFRIRQAVILVPEDPIVAIALLAQDDLDQLSENLILVWPVDHVPRFDELLEAIDETDPTMQFTPPTS